MDRPRVVDLFAGCGGFSLGFDEEGYEVGAAVESFRTSCETYAANIHVGTVWQEDVRNVGLADLGKPDVLIGGPPCEGFTAANADRRVDPLSRLYHDKQGSLTIRYIQLLKELKPRFFVMENVPDILDGPLEEELRMLFGRAGYPDVTFHDLRAEEHGAPSRRRRVFISNATLDVPRGGAPPTVRQAIGDIESLDADVANHVPLDLRGKRGQRMRELDAGESVYHWKGASGRVHGFITRLAADEVAPTVMGSSRFVHYAADRLLTPREHARLMGYPDDFVFHGSKNEQYNQVGESVPPPLSRAIARAVRRALGAVSERS